MYPTARHAWSGAQYELLLASLALGLSALGCGFLTPPDEELIGGAVSGAGGGASVGGGAPTGGATPFCEGRTLALWCDDFDAMGNPLEAWDVAQNVDVAEAGPAVSPPASLRVRAATETLPPAQFFTARRRVNVTDDAVSLAVSVRPIAFPTDVPVIFFHFAYEECSWLLYGETNGLARLRSQRNAVAETSMYDYEIGPRPSVGSWTNYRFTLQFDQGKATSLAIEVDGQSNASLQDLAVNPDCVGAVGGELQMQLGLHFYTGPPVEIYYDNAIVEAVP